MLTGAAIGGAAAPVLHAIGNAGAAAGRWFRGGASAPETLANALTQDRIAPQNVNMLTQQMGPGAMVADIGGQTQNLAAKVAGSMGQAQDIVRNTIEARAANASTRLPQAVGSTLGTGRPVGALTDSIIAQQKAAAAPLYDAVRDVPVQMTPELHDFLQTPLGQKALAKGKELAANDGVRLGNEPAPTASVVANQILAGKLTPEEGERQIAAIAAGNVPQTPKLTVGILDYSKRALDDQAPASLREGNNNAARQASSKAADLTAAVDAQVPGYAAARAAFAGPAKVLDAVNMGQQVFTKGVSPEDLQSAMASCRPPKRTGCCRAPRRQCSRWSATPVLMPLASVTHSALPMRSRSSPC
jgi:hypothetical protein